jgi:DNA-binding MarR family transcriptional regulator
VANDDELRLLRLFQRFGVELVRYQRHMAGTSGVGQTDMLALGLLAVRGPMTVSALGRELELSSASVTGLVDRLVASGHLARVRDEVDRRRIVVHTTALAGDTARAALAGFLAELRLELGRCTAAERAAAATVLERAIAALDRGRERPLPGP